MKPQWQKQNEAIWAQQKRMKDMAYYQQQMQQKPPPSKGWQPKSRDEFARVEAETRKLQQALSSGKLDQAAFDKALKDLIIADPQGRWWMLGTETHTWYRYDGENWMVDTPPGRLSPQAIVFNPVSSAKSPTQTGVSPGFWLRWVVVSVITSTIGIAIAEVVGGFRLLTPNIINNYVPGALIGLALGLGQLMVLGRYTRNSFFLLLGYLVSGLLIGMSTLNFVTGFVMGLVNAIAGFFILKKDYKNSGLYLLFRSLILGIAWMFARTLTLSIGLRPFGDNPMLEVAGYGLLNGLIAGLFDGILLGIILLVILRKPKTNA